MRILFLIISLLMSCSLFGQRILIEESIFLEDEQLLLFPLVDNKHQFRYVPTNLELSTNKEGKPEFLFMKYVNSEQVIVDNRIYVPLEGGAYVHFLCQLKYPTDAELTIAKDKLSKRLKRKNIQILGPIGIKDAGVAVISSIAKMTPNLLWNNDHNTPVFEGGKIAQSFQLGKTEAATLKASLKNNTSDISVALDLSVYGFSSPRVATIKIDWERLYEYKNETKNQNFIFYKKEAQELIKRLENKAIIEYEPVEAEELDDLPNAVYEKLINIIFEPIPEEEQPLIKKKGLAEVTNFLDATLGTDFTPLLNIGLNSAYRYRKDEVKMNATINFKGYELINQNFLILSNLNELLKSFEHEELIKVVDISQDKAGKGRRLQLDARKYLPDFKDILERIEVVIIKNHENGKITDKRIVLEESTIDSIHYFWYANVGRQTYEDWKKYEIQTTWHFKNGNLWTSPRENFAADFIPLKCPYKSEAIAILVDSIALTNQQVKRIDILFEYQAFGETNANFIQKRLYPNSPEEDKQIHVITSANELMNAPYTIRYKIGGKKDYKEQKGFYKWGFIDTELEE